MKSSSMFMSKIRPLADLLRPKSIKEVIGQDHLLGEGKPLRCFLETKSLPSLIFWGPPGCGKTTLARLLAKEINSEFLTVSALSAGVADLRKVFETANEYKAMGKETLLFIDEIHRFNRAQQDVLLSVVEEGTITLVGATTENPSFELNAALLSRCRIMVLNRLGNEHLEQLLKKAESYKNTLLPLTTESRSLLIQMADGDGRAILNFAESLFLYKSDTLLNQAQVIQIVQRRAPIYDKAQEGHYNLISALHKSVRGSDPDAALYWFSRMVDAGEDCLFIARRLVRMAIEDIGLADPHAINQAIAAREAFSFLGSPEGELALAQCVVYLATAPKSNAVYLAYKKSLNAAQIYGSVPPPKHILNAPTKLMKDLGYGDGYIYDHNTEQGFSGQNYFPEAMERQAFYEPTGRGSEKEISEHLKELSALRKKNHPTSL